MIAPADVAPLLDVVVEVLGESTFTGGVNVFAEAVYRAEVVSALEPADVDPLLVVGGGRSRGASG